ncbi:MAG: DUF1236 domain-containing protein [Rhizobiaceae bacterium]|nr:DUF1236 domain-containing protein [Rhizobiaceae bacterium]
MKRNHIALAAASMLVAMSGAAFAQSAVVATTDLNVRAGPGPEHPVIGMIGAGQGATLEGCLEGSKWCTVAFAGGSGWAYSDYLTGDFGGQAVVLTERPADSGVRIVPAPSTDGQTTGAITGGTAGAIGGAIIAGPVGAIVGGAAGALGGAATGTVIDPPGSVRTYVSEQRGDPVYLEGEVVVGATLPDTVELRAVPDYEYRYVYVNGQPVLVEPDSRRIVYVLR